MRAQLTAAEAEWTDVAISNIKLPATRNACKAIFFFLSLFFSLSLSLSQHFSWWCLCCSCCHYVWFFWPFYWSVLFRHFHLHTVVVPESTCSSTSLRWNSQTAWNPLWLDWTTTWEMWGKKTLTWKLPLSTTQGKSKLLKTSLNVQFFPLWIVRPECSATLQQAVPLMHRSWMDRLKQAFCRCPKPLRPINVQLQHPFSPPPLTRPLTLPPSTQNNQSSCLQTKQRLKALPTARGTIPDIWVNSSRQVPPSLRLPKEGSTAALLTGDSNRRHCGQTRAGPKWQNPCQDGWGSYSQWFLS